MARFDKRSRQKVLSGSLFGAGVLLAIVLFAISNYFGWKYHKRFDWTESQLYSLSEKTENVLTQLDRDMEVVVFLSPGEELFGAVSEQLARYEAGSARIRVRYVDPEKNLLEAQSLVDKYELSHLNVVVFDSGDDRRIVDSTELADYDYSGMQYGQGAQLTGFKGEQVFTSTLLDLMESRKPRILFTTGHGELSLDDGSPEGMSLARELLGKDNFELEEWATIGQSQVPHGTDLLVIAGPDSTFLEPELQVLRNYLETGGRMLVLLDPTLSPTDGLVETGLEALLVDFGVQVGDDIVVDPSNPLPFFGAETLFVTSYSDHTIVRSLDQAQLPVVVALARSVGLATEASGYEMQELMRTTADGWGETGIDNLQEVGFDDLDLPGPVPLAVAVETASEGTEGGSESLGTEGEGGEDRSAQMRLVVIGDSDVATNAQLQNVPNATFLANALNWLVEREALVGIPPKEPEQVKLSMTSSELSRLTWLVLIVLPGFVILAGLGVYLRRRR
jgi:ABC-type uncharacterized transport system involved in gliding motility auxiliary subunit